MRKDSPYAKGLKLGDSVKAGQIIGYSGQTGYSIKENVNNINVPHLHFGMQLIFDESQKECLSEIWINTYPLIRLLSQNRAEPVTDAASLGAGTAAAVTDAASAKPEEEAVDLPILMYHGLTDQASQVGDYYVPAQTFEEDMKYLKENGYTAITMTELIDYVYDKSGQVRLPKKPVIITFDDGFLNNDTFATPVLKKYGMKAVISIIVSATKEMSEVQYKNEKTCAVSFSQLRQNGRFRPMGNSEPHLQSSRLQKRQKRGQPQGRRRRKCIRNPPERGPDKGSKTAEGGYRHIPQYLYLALRNPIPQSPGSS